MEEPETLIDFTVLEHIFKDSELAPLDLGVRRERQLNTTNDLKLFMEEFEAAAKGWHDLKEEKND